MIPESIQKTEKYVRTSHLHIDYIPSAMGYSQGLRVRNSLSKVLENHSGRPILMKRG